MDPEELLFVMVAPTGLDGGRRSGGDDRSDAPADAPRPATAPRRSSASGSGDGQSASNQRGSDDSLPVRRRSRKPLHPIAATGEMLPPLPEPAPASQQPAPAASAPGQPRAAGARGGRKRGGEEDDEDYVPHAAGRRGSDGSGASGRAPRASGGAAAAAAAAGAAATAERAAGGGGRSSPAFGSRLLAQRAVAPTAAAAVPPAGTSGYFGVSWSKSKQRWDACFRARDVKLFRRNYHTAEEAARAWDLAARERRAGRGPWRRARAAIWGLFDRGQRSCFGPRGRGGTQAHVWV